MTALPPNFDRKDQGPDKTPYNKDGILPPVAPMLGEYKKTKKWIQFQKN